MVKVLTLLLLSLISQTALSNDFLLAGKQLLVCENEEILFRINWEDWQIENKSFGVRSKDRLLKIVLKIDRDEAEQVYRIDTEYEAYRKGEPVSGQNAQISIGESLGDGTEPDQYFQLYYVDKDKSDSDVKKTCKR
jgi:hypothetical protein